MGPRESHTYEDCSSDTSSSDQILVPSGWDVSAGRSGWSVGRASGEEGSGAREPRQDAAAGPCEGVAASLRAAREGAVPRGGGAGDAPGSARGLGADAAGRIHQGSVSGAGSARGEGSGCESGVGAGVAGPLLLLQGEGDEDAAGTVLDCSWLQDAVLGAAGDEGAEDEGAADHLRRGVGEVRTGPFPGGTLPGGVVPQGGAHPVATPGGDGASYAEVEPPGGEICDAVIAYDGAET